METSRNKDLYDAWSRSYDDVVNPTRDLEARAIRDVLGQGPLGNVIELGSGTGKNTTWLAERAVSVIATDLSPAMQFVAKEKVTQANVRFEIVDLTKPWPLANGAADTITASLVLEHIENLAHIFDEAARILAPDGKFYICELHPFKQYLGSKARFEQNGNTITPDCFTHNISDYLSSAKASGFETERVDEWFDEDDRREVPRLISFVFKRR